MKRTITDVALTMSLTVVALLLVADLIARSAPVQAANPAPPEVKPCQIVNTAKVSDVLTILVFKCEPENGAPYLLNTVGFMKDIE